MLYPLTISIPNKVKFEWIEVEQKAFDESKLILEKHSLISYPDLNKSFDIHTDSGKFQLEAVIIQGR